MLLLLQTAWVLHAGAEGASGTAAAIKELPAQQQLLLCAATTLLGAPSMDAALGAESPLRGGLPCSPAKGTPLKCGTPARRLSNLGCATPLSLQTKARQPILVDPLNPGSAQTEYTLCAGMER